MPGINKKNCYKFMNLDGKIEFFEISNALFLFSLIAEDNFLLSSENLRASPELWPEKIPGSDNYTKTVSKHVKENENGLTQDDIRNIYRKFVKFNSHACNDQI
jgi:hypothetical protein